MYCTTCWSEFNSEITAQTHYQSNSHLESEKFQQEFKENRLLGPYYCQLCSLYTNSFNSLAVHLGSKTHRNKIASKEKIQALEEKKNPTSNAQSNKLASTPTNLITTTTKIVHTEPNTTSKLNNYCEVCTLQLDSAIAYAVHLGSNSHKANFKNYIPSKNNTPVFIKHSQLANDHRNATFTTNKDISCSGELSPWPNLQVQRFKELFCNVCLIFFKTEENLTLHFLSEKHKKKVEVLELINKLNDIERDSSFGCRKSESSLDFSVDRRFDLVNRSENRNIKDQNAFDRNHFNESFDKKNNNYNILKRTKDHSVNNFEETKKPITTAKVLTQIDNKKSAPISHLQTTQLKNSSIPNSDYWFDNENPPSTSQPSMPISDDRNLLNLLNNIKIESLKNSADWCHCCYLKYTSESEKKKHLEGREHQRRVEIKEKLFQNLIDPADHCEYCFMKIQDGVQKIAHLKSNSHQLQIKRRIEYLNYVKSQALNVGSPSEATKRSLKSSKTYTNMFPVCETELTETFNELDVNIDIFKKSNVKIFKYFNKNHLLAENNSKKEPKQFESIEDALIALSQSSINNESTSSSDKQSENENSDAYSSLNLDECKEANQDDGEIDKYIQENFVKFEKSLSRVFESIAKISSAGYE